jgi:hypothetical protein
MFQDCDGCELKAIERSFAAGSFRRKRIDRTSECGFMAIRICREIVAKFFLAKLVGMLIAR